jgi:hypothetical protein
MISPVGEAESENAVTLRFSVIVAGGKPLEVPVMVSAAVPRVAVELAVRARVLLLVVGFAVHVADTPAGSPETARVTLPVNPPTSNTLTVLAPVPP